MTALDAALARQWLGILHGDTVALGGLVHVCSTGDWTGRTFADLDAATNYVRYLDGEGREGIYVRVTTLRGGWNSGKEPGRRGGAVDTAALPALWADLDLAGPGHAEQDLPPDEQAGRAIIAATGLPEPTLWIHSGGGLYPIWLLDRPHEIGDDNCDSMTTAVRLARDWQRVIEHAAAGRGWRYGRGVGDLARVLRMPGTVNRKEGLARPCRILSATSARYTVEQLVAALDAAMARITPPAPVVPATGLIGVPAPTTKRPEGAQPGEDFNQRADWADILTPAGWREHYRHDEVTYWTRPGKTTGISASTNALGTDRLHVFTTSASPLEGGESYSKFGAYALLAHSGDHRAAARALGRQGYGAALPDPAVEQRALPRELLGGDLGTGVPPTDPSKVSKKRTWDDIGNADRLTDRYSDILRWTVDAEKWAVYTGTRWDFEGAPTYILGLVREMLDNVSETELYEYDNTPRVGKDGKEKPSQQEEFLLFIKRQRIHARMAAATVVARTHKPIQLRMEDFDADPYLFNCGNGVINLRTGKMLNHDSKLLLSSVAGVDYDPNAQAPQWTRFLATVIPDPDVREYLARIVGYTLTGDTSEQVLFLHHGTGANGKSVFMQVIRTLLGGYGQAIPQGTLLAKASASGAAIPNDIARMVGKRLLITSETGAGRRLDDELVKQLTGGEAVSARFMRGEFFEFTPIGKIHVMTNHLPNVGGGTGIARRLQDIGWDVTIPPEKRDKRLAARIIAHELPGVLAWAVRGCQEWQKRGLDTPEAVRKKTEEHVHQADPIAQWAEERTNADPDCEVETRELYADYRAWTEGGGARPMTEKAFTQVLDERGWQRGKHPTNRRSVFYGVRLLPRVFGEGVINGGFRIA